DYEMVVCPHKPKAEFELTIEGTVLDDTPPTVSTLAWGTADVTAGAPASITATLPGSSADTTEVVVTVAQEYRAGRPLWEHKIQLVNRGEGTWEGTFLAPVTNLQESPITVTNIKLLDADGNRTDMGASDLAALNVPTLPIREASVPGKLKTEPYIVNVLHIGAYDYLDWNQQDISALGDLFDQLDTDPAGARATINWQLLTLIEAAKTLRQEIYTAPGSGFRFVPFNTSGKWLALDKAFMARLRLLREAALREGTLSGTPAEKGAFLQYASLAYGETGYLAAWDPADLAEQGNRLMASVISTIERSELQKDLMKLAHKAPSGDEVSLLDRDLIWFMPFEHAGALAEHYDNGREIMIYLSDAATPEELIHSLFHEIGHHFSDIFNDPLFLTALGTWKDYLKVRQTSNNWTPTAGWASRPQENLADDFAYAFLPADLAPHYDYRTAFAPLSSDPDMLKAFRGWMANLAARGPESTFKLTHQERILVGAVAVSGTAGPVKLIHYWQTDDLADVGNSSSLNRYPVPADGNFYVPLKGGSYVPQYLRLKLQQEASHTDPIYEGSTYRGYMTYPERSHNRFVTVLPFPVPGATDFAPRVTNLANVSLFRGGQILGWTLTAGGVKGTKVTLAPGENQIEVVAIPPATGDAAPFTMIASVYYEPEGALAFSAVAPSTVEEPQVTIQGRTEPRSIIRAGGTHTTSDRLGRYTLVVTGLKPGRQTIEVSVTSPGGNTATKTLTVTYDAPQ
ncbi:MAG: hypothetical protein K0R39_4633, partial [Symbiobacteriaceae bacterium]|nr:hypothetical protein [Symbiobacteriaceae bacterium]